MSNINAFLIKEKSTGFFLRHNIYNVVIPYSFDGSIRFALALKLEDAEKFVSESILKLEIISMFDAIKNDLFNEIKI